MMISTLTKMRRLSKKPSVLTPKTRENISVFSVPTQKIKEQAIKDARKKYVSEKLKTKAEAEKSVSENYTADIPKQNAELIKTETSAPKSDFTTNTAFLPKSMPKTKDNYIHSRGNARANRKVQPYIFEQRTSRRFSLLRRFVPRRNYRRERRKRKYPCYPLFEQQQ